MNKTDAVNVAVTLSSRLEPDPPLNENEKYFIIGTVTFVREGPLQFYNFAMDHQVKIEYNENRPADEREVSIYCRGSIVYVKPYMMDGPKWLPTWVVVRVHRHWVSKC